MTFKWDGKSRPSDDLYRKNFDRIFKCWDEKSPIFDCRLFS